MRRGSNRPAAILVCIVLAVLCSVTGFSQDYTQMPGRNTGDRMNPFLPGYEDPFAEEGEGEPGDSTTRERKVRKPLESYFFDDSTRTRDNFAWTVDTYRNKVRMAVIDTLTTGFQITYPYLQKGVGDAMQGPLGGASVPLSYFDRPHYRDFSFGQAYDAYNIFPERALFFNVKRPLTIFTYLTAGQKQKAEENFGITHAQNISPSTGFNIDYKSRGTKGVYNWQRTRAKNLSVAFSHTGKKYSVHAGYIYNTNQNRENGGIEHDSFLTDSISFEQPNTIPTKLNDALSVTKNNVFYVTQTYGAPLRKLTEDDFSIADQSSIFFGHSFEWSRWHRVYTDTRAKSQYGSFDTNTKHDYYHDWFIDPTATADSIAEIKLSNRLFVQIQPFDRDGIVGTIDAGVGMDNHTFYQFVPSFFLEGVGDGVKKTGYYAYGSVEGKFRRYLTWGGDAEYRLAGYRNGDVKVGADLAVSAYIKDRPLTLSGRFSHDRRSADYWSERYFSNHFAWSNSFDKENETRIEAAFTMPWAGLELGAYQSVVNNRIYYVMENEMLQPLQASESVSVTGVYLRKDFRAGGFHFNHRVMLQWSTSQEIIPVPFASAYLSYFFEFNIVRNVLRAQFGVDGRFNTKWYAYGWEPSSGRFYNHQETKVGEYPMLDVFLNAKWKRMRILLKMEHLNDDLFGRRTYFAIPHYPQNKRVFKLGFSWSFYD